MAELLKEMFFSKAYLKNFAITIKEVYPDFDDKKFLTLVFNKDWKNKELKEKMRQTTP